MADRYGAGEVAVPGQLGTNELLVAEQSELERAVFTMRASDPGDDGRRAGVSSHCIDRDPRACVHRFQPRASFKPLGFGRNDLAAVIMAACLAKVVRQLQFTAVRAFLKRSGLQRMMAAAHVPLGRRSFSFRDSHSGTFKKQ
jgi:hypothetical protein